MGEKQINLGLTALDELFMTDAGRKEARQPKIQDIPIELIDDFPNHPFQVRLDEDMDQLVESVKQNGIITPVTLRPKEDGRYEIVSGHRRKKACELAGLETLRTEIVDMDRDSSIIFMVDSNLQRTRILPSEKGFSYKMRLEAMNRQGKRTDLTSGPVGQKLSREKLAEDVGESGRQIHRYIRITELVPELIDLVDSGEVSLRPAVELSYLPDEEQYMVLEAIETEVCTPSHAQTIKMRKYFEDGKLTPELVSSIMSEEKPNQKEKIVLRGDRVRQLIPKSIPLTQTEEYVCKALEHYSKYLRNRSERGR